MKENTFFDIIKFVEEDISERTGKQYRIPVDKKDADILLIRNESEVEIKEQ